MSSDYSDDQYRADYESRYPMFSDYQVTDAMIAEHKWKRPARAGEVNTYESKYQTEQMGIPTYLGCQCGKCPMSEWPRVPQMRRCTIDQRAAAMDGAFERRCSHTQKRKEETAEKPTDSVESMRGGYYGNTDQTTIMLVLMFIMFVFICYCMKTIIEMKAQLKSIIKATE